MIFIAAQTKIVLASRSPARLGALLALGIKAEVYVTDASEEIDEGLPPGEIVSELSGRKAKVASAAYGDPKVLIIAADTIVEHRGKIIGKPEGESDARDTLALLSGDFHRVYSGITVAFDDKSICGFDVTTVKFRDIGQGEIDKYIKTGDPFLKAGSYGVQGPGAALVERIEGDFFNVVGLPVAKFAEILKDGFGLTIFDLII
ncbi:MAG: Maf family protein [Oscillospiraceae bacterium]|nr:Maf family protein [Oscillospiraceae bacterium]